MSTHAPAATHQLSEWVLRRSRRVGPVARGWLGRPYAYLVGPEANEAVFAGDGHFSAFESMKALIPVDGPTSVVVSDPPEHGRRRALVRPGLHHKQVAGYVATMASAADEALDAVTPGVPFDAYALFRSAIRRSTMRALFGERVGAEADALGESLQPLLDLTNVMPDLIGWHERLNTPTWRRARAARAEVDAFVFAEIDRLGSVPEEAESQVLATLVHGRDGTGSGLSREEVRDQVVTLIAAGYETTSAAMAWAIHGLGGRPDALAAARAEVQAVTGGAAPTPEDLPRLQWVGAVVSEALRLYPPAPLLPRHVVQEFSVLGHTIKPGTMVMLSPYATHRLPELYPDPLAFRPERWLDGLKPSPAEYLPFGGGAHRCLGSMMATTELTVMLARLLARGSFTPAGGPVRAVGLSSMQPSPGVRIMLG